MEKHVPVESNGCDQQSNGARKARSDANRPTHQQSLHLMDRESGLVDWVSPTDPLNPKQSPMASSMVAPGTALTLQEFNEPSQILGSFMVTIFVLGYAVGPLFLAPLSEIYGRYPVVILSTWTFNAWILGSALAPNMVGLTVMRFLAGVGGSGVMTIAPAIVADLYPVERRGFASSLIVLAQSLGPAIGPICGGFISESLGWRWAYWVLLIASASVTLLMTVIMPESYAPKILQKRARQMQKVTGRTDIHPQLDQNISTKAILARSIARPTKMLTTSPVVLLICAYVATVYGFLYLLFTTLPIVFSETYGWPTSLVGLAYTPLALGMIMAIGVIMKTNDANVIKLTKKNNNIYEPEMRLSSTIYYAAVLPVSLFWYGWSTEQKVHWAVPIVGLIPFGWGMIGIFLPCQTYLVDVFTDYSASAVAASRTSLSIVGAFLPLAGPPLYQALGFGFGNTVLGVIALVMTPIPLLLYKYNCKLTAPEIYKHIDLCDFPFSKHKLVVPHRDGRNTLYLTSYIHHIDGMSDDESQILLDELFTHATQPKYRQLVPWENDSDLIMWDNTAVLHRATGGAYLAENVRDMRRTTSHDTGVHRFGMNDPTKPFQQGLPIPKS
ncbi:hypothetical protein AJ80_09294 [Polytolypa hystricis UAMH7299]|uniref:Major facilitator superfamily (MFS) profile domain-containing protein n=1 Tax=Polytolypa hystricis (strain UAMH7299) TaxID=1447883 RepID=A0A2B7WTF0_POLH7|nr:hypothetical protein AJ80_09294 [Polytolypa hystricis UAMH7299]